MFNIVLVHPQIPQNTGSIGRMCVNTDSTLHVVKPTVFDLSEKAVRRAEIGRASCRERVCQYV